MGRGRITDVFAWESDAVVKLFGDGSARAAIEQEAANGRLARAAGMPVPDTRALIEVVGRPDIVYERVDGPSMLSVLPRAPWKLLAHARTLAELHVAMHG